MKKLYTIIVLFIISSSSFAQAPVLNPINGPASVCSAPSGGSSFSAFATNSPTAYVWTLSPSAGVTITGNGNSNVSISFPYSNGNYTITCVASNSSGSSAPKTFTVNVFETPTVTFSGANTFCQGSSTALQASSTILAGSSTIFYNWSPSTGLNTTSGPNVIASPNVPTTYTVIGTIGNCSNASTITINPLVSPSLSYNIQNNNACMGQTVAITVTGANTYMFNNGIMNGVPFTTSTSIVNVFVTGAAQNGCTSTIATSINSLPVPNINVSSSQPFLCQYFSATIFANGNANTYSLNTVQMNPNGAQSASLSVTPSVTTIYTVTGTGSNGCESTTTFTQNVALCNGINQQAIEKNSPVLYPNPSNGSFNIKSTANETVIITNELGQLIRTITIEGGKDEPVNGLTRGIYFIITSTTKSKLVVIN